MTVFDDLIAAANPTILTRDVMRQQGASWEIRQYLSVNGAAMDWTGCTVASQIRKPDGTSVYSFNSLTADSTGWVILKATPSDTASLAVGFYDYDVDITNGSGRKLAFMAGRFVISKQVTQ